MKTVEIITLVFSIVIGIIILVVVFNNLRKRGSDKLGYFHEKKVLPNGDTYVKFSGTTLASFLCLLFWFIGDMILLNVIADNIGKEVITWQFMIVFLIFNVIFALAVFAPKQLKNIDYNQLISILKSKTV